MLGFVGQVAWTVENMYLNVFVYDPITDVAIAIAIMVALSAASATPAMVLVGALSDRVGRRRVFASGAAAPRRHQRRRASPSPALPGPLVTSAAGPPRPTRSGRRARSRRRRRPAPGR
ncbi:hypothetical protein ACIBQX_24160 [Nonomuraea sp. NPDC049714]|uniref:hypothetical protein n=1 Tax=Nonomuraea sp. NPDC049714 TaxID=3364357 RepID=UPI0037B31E52